MAAFMLPSDYMNQKALERRIKKHIIAGNHRIYFSVIPGLEEPAMQELLRLGIQAEKLKTPGSLEADCTLETLWKTLTMARTPARVYLRLLSFKAEGFREFRNKTHDFPWELYLSEGCEYRLRFSLTRCRLHVTDNIGKSLKRSISERFEKMEGTSPVLTDPKLSREESSVQTILIRGEEDRFQLSLDAGGGPLYERGYRKYINEAPIRETLAASLLEILAVQKDEMLMDPMCGSGTFALEALGSSSGMPAFPDREFPFLDWPSFKPARFEWHMNTILEKVASPCRVLSSDIDEKSLQATRANRNLLIEKWQGSRYDVDINRIMDHWEIRREDFFASLPHPGFKTALILNPPYGFRLKLQDRLDFFQRLGKKIRQDYKDCRWGIIVPDQESEKAMGLHWEKKYIFTNGGLKVAFITGKS